MNDARDTSKTRPDANGARTSDLLVVGAGAMGAWTAYWAQAGGGRRVALLDAWGAGHSRSSSGDENRIIRSAHGDDALYTRWSRRAREHWLRFQNEWDVPLFVECGVLWFAHRDDAFEDRSIGTFEAVGVPHERLGVDELRRRWPQLGDGGGLEFAVYEPESGALMARRACQAATAAFLREGGSYTLAGVRPGRTAGGRLLEVRDQDGEAWSAESFVFACGPWLPRLFPDVLGSLIRVTKQDVIYVGPRAGDARFHAESLPAWADYDAAYYGVSAIDDRGFKIAPDRYGPIFDPTAGERVVDAESTRLARRYLAQRFPDLATAPVVETRVCAYESTPDAHFIIDRHPAYENVWIAGGGSGHGFKHGPRIGEYLVARLNGATEGDQDGADESRFRIGLRSAGNAARTGGDDMAATWELF
jgi:sarcosine oxidase